MKRALMVLILLTLALILCSCGSREIKNEEPENKLIVVGFTQVGAESDWRNANTLSMTEALSEANGYRLLFEDAQNKQERQITSIRNFIQMGVDYIVLAPTTEVGWDTVLTEAKSAGIPVIIVDRMIEVSDESLYACWVGSDFREEGRVACAYLENRFQNDEISIVHLQGNMGSSAQIGRTDAFNEAFAAHPSWKLAAQLPGDFTQAKGQEIIEDILSSGTSFNVIYSENDNMSFGAIEALKKHGLVPGKDVTIVSFDAGHRALELTMKGEINFCMECNPLHGPRVSAIISQIEAGETPAKLTYVPEGWFDSTITPEILEERPY